MNENYAYSAPPDGSSLAPYDASHYPVAAQANDQAAPFAYPLAGSIQQWNGNEPVFPTDNYTQDTSGEFTYGQTASYLSQFSAIDAQHAGWQPTSQSLSTSTSLGSMVASSTGSSIAVPVDGYHPSTSVDPSTMQHCVNPSTMQHVVDPSTVQHGVGAFPLQSPMHYGAQQDANSPYYQSYPAGYMNYQYPTGYPQLPLLQQSPSIAGGPTFQAPGGAALSRCSSKSSRSSSERQKKTLTEREKQEICLMAATQPNLTQAQIAKIFM
ncbi:MAG: hypothetical protein EOO77_44785 [Oxalobacteraceae bacterium]|nr:MAG: hypothetical protein EOO77_44785 [Oxalobacteraceae bacterium]